MLAAVDIAKSYLDRSTGRNFVLLDACSLQISPGEAVGLAGPSGCGKSTLARILLRLLPCDSGRLLFAARDITTATSSQLRDFRRQVQFISQRPESFFDPMFKLGQSLLEPLTIFSLPEDDRIIGDVLETVKLTDDILDRYPHQVSGGEIQRLSIARALLLQPKLLILDEPTSMLDISVQAQILHLLQAVRKRNNMAFLFIAHDQAIIRYMCDRTLLMKDGRIDCN